MIPRAEFQAALRIAMLITLMSAISLAKDEESVFSFGNKPASVDFNQADTTLINSRTLLLNLNDSALSNGSLNSWSFCYFVLDSEEGLNHINVGVWRLVNDTYYSLVNGSLVTLPTSREFDFVCLKLSVSPVEVLEGDVVGAIVTAIPAVFSIVGSDEDSQMWTSPLPNNHDDVISMNLTSIPNCGLYLEGLGVDDPSGPDSTESTDLAKEVSLPLWAIYAIGFLALFLVLSLCIVCFLSVTLKRQGKKSAHIELSRSDVHFSSMRRNSHELKPDSRNGLSVSHASAIHDVLQPPTVIFENANTDEHQTAIYSPRSPSGDVVPSTFANGRSSRTPLSPRSETFSFPPPSVRAPSPPPCTDQDSSDPSENHTSSRVYQQRMLRKTQSNPLHSASSLPDLLSDETLYEAPFRTPGPYIYAGTSPKSNPVNTDPGETEAVMSDVFSTESMKQRGLGTAAQTTQPYANAKTRVSRLQSAPWSAQEYEEPEMRARFYSYRGMRLSSLTKRVGALKKPMPLPDDGVKPTDPQYSDTSTVLENSITVNSIKVSDHEVRESELETTLDRIEEMDEQESLPATSRPPSQKNPELYLEPVHLMTN